MTSRVASPQNRSYTRQHGSQLGNIGMTLIMQGPAISHEKAPQTRLVDQPETGGDGRSANR